MKVVWTATAVARLEAIEDFIASDDPQAAERFIDALLAIGESLADSPQRGRVVPELPGSGLREVIHHGYRIVYRATTKRIEILTVFQGHRLLREDELG
ncbi:MAG: type II toxin-antitoxin system RelE/ParE family toxin [Deltaproteobacteria bacterium]|nr:type II toxin-antitoxin system RelE/ParE family toxin [Deltaproteobacteria bacterium]